MCRLLRHFLLRLSVELHEFVQSIVVKDDLSYRKKDLRHNPFNIV